LKRVHTVIRSVAALALIASVSCGGAIAQQQQTHLPVPATAIYPGDVIREEMIIDRTFAPNMPGVAAFFAERTLVVGQIARTLIPGQPIPINAIEEQKVVTRGNVVKVVVEDGALSIVTYASSLQSGSPGAMIQLRNLDTGVIIRGVVQQDGSVRIQNG